MDERTPLIAGNWKMHKGRGEAFDYASELAGEVGGLDAVDIAVCPPFTAIDVVADLLGPLGVGVWGQTMHEAESGAYTGEVSAEMLDELDVHGVILGHSERRQYYNETDRALALKVPKALQIGLLPVLCVGETEEERDGGDTERKLRHQVQEGLAKVPKDRLADVVIAYEPIWAIGTGEVDTPEDAQEVCAALRETLGQIYNGTLAGAARVLYGGSVKSNNAVELMAAPDVDGALVGGASLIPEDFVQIVRAGRESSVTEPA